MRAVDQKQAGAIQRIVQNAEASGITPSQLQQLLSGVSFETGLFGKLTPDNVKEAFSGAALKLAQKQDAALRELPPPKTPEEQRAAVISGATTAPAMLELVKMAFAGKDLAGLPSAAYSEHRTPSGPNVDFKLVLDAAAKQLPMAAAKEFVLGLFDELLSASKAGQLPLTREVLGTVIHDLQMDLARRGFSSTDARELTRKGAELEVAITHPDLKNPDGKIAILGYSEKDDWRYLSNQFGWGR